MIKNFYEIELIEVPLRGSLKIDQCVQVRATLLGRFCVSLQKLTSDFLRISVHI